MAKYHEQTRYAVTDMTDLEFSVLVAGLAVLASQGEAKPARYPEYKERATELLRGVSPTMLQGIESRRRQAEEERRG